MTPEELARKLAGMPVLTQLESLGFSVDFVAKNVMSAPSAFTVSQIAMLWMGMPNKHDRKRTRQLLDAFVDAGLLKRTAEDTYVRA